MAKRLSILLLSLGLASCATSGSPDSEPNSSPLPQDAALSELPPKTLARGECGLFGWGRESGRFTFFSTEDKAQYVANSRLVNLIPEGLFPATQYAPGVTLKLGVPEFLDGGLRYPNARLVQIQPDGFELIQPLVAVTSCVE